MPTRQERVEISLVDAGFSTTAARLAAATALLEGRLDSLDGTRVDFDNGMKDSNDGLVAFDKNSRTTAASIDTLSGRLGIAARAIGAFGPAAIPITALAIPAVAGLANQLGFTAIAAGTAIAAFQGVGDALTAVNDAALDPTVENIHKAREALNQLSPIARSMVAQLDSMRPIFEDLRDTAAAGLFPGLIEGFQELERLAPAVESVLTPVSRTIGHLFAEGAEALAGPEWADFFAMLALEARPTLMDLGHAIGSVVHGLSELWEAFAPLNRDFGSWIADAARGFDRWATGLSQTEGFADFVQYLRENGPLVADAVVAIANAVIQIVEAAAPLGGPVLQAITAFAEAVAAIADSPLGTPIMAAVTAMSALSLATNVATAATLRLKAAQATLGVGGKGAPAATGTPAAVGGGLASGLALIGLMDTAPDFIQNLQMMADGERSVWEGMARMVAGANPVGAALNLLGVNVLGTEEKFLEASLAGIDFSHSVEQASGSSRRAALPINKLAQSLARQREAAYEGAKAFRNLTTEMSPKRFDLGKWLDQQQWIAESLRNFRINAQQAADKGLRRGLIRELQRLGPEGAIQLDALADATDKQIKRANAVWRTQQVEIRRAREEVRATGDEIRKTGGIKAKPQIDVESNAGGVVAEANRALMGIDGNTAHTYVYTHLRTVRDSGNTGTGGPQAPNGTFADGGYTGPGGKYEPRGIVHAGEIVLPQEIVKRDWSMLASRYGHLPGFADGGMVPAPVRQRGRGGTVRQVIEHRVIVTGELDARRAMAAIRQDAHEIAEAAVEGYELMSAEEGRAG